jgi:hypothetical protein
MLYTAVVLSLILMIEAWTILHLELRTSISTILYDVKYQCRDNTFNTSL